MKKIILSVAVATMALSTAASALEDIKVSGQAKVWYETNDVSTNTMFDDGTSSGEVVFKIGVTGKQGNVGFGATVYQTSTMGLENNLVGNDRHASSGLGQDFNSSNTNMQDDGEMYTGEMYITIPAAGNTALKIGKQELDTPYAFTERWNAVPNTFNGAVAINSAIENVTLIGAYVGQGGRGEVTSSFFEGAYMAAALYNNKTIAANVFYYDLKRVAQAVWADAGMKLGPVAAKVYFGQMDPKAAIGTEKTTAYALSAAGKVGPVSLMAAYSTVSDKGALAIGNTATAFKKTKLPTAGVYTDGLYVAQPGSDAFKIKASGKLGTTGLALQYIDNDNNADGANTGYNNFTSASRKTQEIDLIITHKVGDVNLKGIIMDRSFDDAATDVATGGAHVRVIASVNF